VFVSQEDVSFAIPFIDEDIPLYLDPFLLWKSPSQQDNALHGMLLNSFNSFGKAYVEGREQFALDALISISECREVGFGSGKSKRGTRISKRQAKLILNLFQEIPRFHNQGFMHFEEIQLYVENISKDRISDISCNLLKSFLIDFTQQECMKHGIPMVLFDNLIVYDSSRQCFVTETINLPCNPEDNTPIVLVPKRWLRFTPWINFDDYYEKAFIKEGEEDNLKKPSILEHNRKNYDMVALYVSEKERTSDGCKNDPLFRQIPVTSAKKSLGTILSLATGIGNRADRKFEDQSTRLMASLLYPHLDFAQAQSRVESGTLIRDLVFYNNCDYPFLKELHNDYECKQIVIEMKNVQELIRDHVNQLNRYLTDQFGRFGIMLTRNAPKKSIMKNLVDLWSGQRKCIIVLTDEDVKMMVNVFETKQRDPLEVIKKKYVEFMRQCPS
jgi:hypothetical protein